MCELQIQMDLSDAKLEEQELSTEMNSNLIDVIDNLLHDAKYDEVSNTVKQNLMQLSDEGLDLIPVVCKHLTDDEDPDHTDARNCCEEILDILSRFGNAKEILVGLLEQADGDIDDFKMKILLTPIQNVLKRLPAKRGKSLEWVLSVLHKQVSSLPLPKTNNFEENERKLLDLLPETHRISDIMSHFVHFYKPFVEEISIANDSGKCDYRRHKMTYFLLQLLDRPLAYVDLTHKDGDAKSTLRVVAEKIVHNIKQMQYNFFKLFAFNSQIDQFEDDSLEQTEKLSDLSTANFFYLVFAEGVEYSYFPCVYAHVHLLESSLPYINALLKRCEECATHKGLLLPSFFLTRIAQNELGVFKLDYTHYIMFAQNLINVMLYSNVQDFRQVAVTLFRQYVNKFNLAGRYQLLKCLLDSNDHSGVMGLLIQCFKDNLNAALAVQPVPAYFIGSNLNSVISTVTRLDNGVETDVLDQSDRLLSALNLIRFLALRDQPRVNITGFWNLVKNLQNNFLKPLRQCLDFSRAHYNLELKYQIEEDENCSQKRMLPVTKQHSEQILKLALNTFDVIESITGRIEELLSAGKNTS